MKYEDRARLLRLRAKLTLHEAAYLVVDRLGGTWDDAVSLLVENVERRQVVADVVLKPSLAYGMVVTSADPAKTTLATSELTAWLEALTTGRAEVSEPSRTLPVAGMQNEIVLPSDTEYIATADIPRLIAEALHPEVNGQALTVSYFIKFARPGAVGEAAKWNGWPIDDDDRTVMASLWAKLPPLPQNATPEQVAPYLAAVNDAGLDWTLDVCWNNADLNSSIARLETESAHQKAVTDAIRRGSLKVISPLTRLPARDYEPDSQASVDELRQYVAQFKLGVRLEAPGGMRIAEYPKGLKNPAFQSLDFLSIAEAVNFIAEAVPIAGGQIDADDVLMWRASEAAKLLHERLSNAVAPGPRWVEIHPETGKPLLNGLVEAEGMAIILHAAGWYGRQVDERNEHVLGCLQANLDPHTEPMLRHPESGQWNWVKGFLREQRIGFIRAELAELFQMPFGAVTRHDRYEARRLLANSYARLDHIAWAMVILAQNAPPEGEGRYRQIHGVVQWIESLGLQFRANNGLPVSLPTGTAVSGMDVREYQYLAVSEVRAAAIAAKCWPVDADRQAYVEGVSPWGNQATKIVEVDEGAMSASVLAYRIAAAFVEIPYDASEEAWEARKRYEFLVGNHLQQISAQVDEGTMALVTDDGVATHDVSIGWLRASEVRGYLDKYCIPWSDAGSRAEDTDVLSDASANRSQPTRPLLQQRHQEQEILRVIRELGEDPKRLPKQKAGTAGIKAAVKGRLSFSESVFKKAWERLRDAGDIADA